MQNKGATPGIWPRICRIAPILLAFLWVASSSAAVIAKDKKRKKRADSEMAIAQSNPPSVEIVVARRLAATDSGFAVFWIGSRGFAGRGLRWHAGPRLVSFTLGASGAPRPIETWPPMRARRVEGETGNAAGTASIWDSDEWAEQPPPTEEPQPISAWLAERAETGADGYALAALVIDGEGRGAGHLRTGCGSCETVSRSNMQVLARGLPRARVEAIANVIAALPGEASAVDRGLLKLAESMRSHWPATVPIHSAGIRRIHGGTSGLDLRIDFDAQGRAHLGLRRLFGQYMGEVSGPKALAEARRAWRNHSKLAPTAAAEAVRIFELALAQRPRHASWLAAKAEAMALRSPSYDAAVVTIRRALQLAPNSLEIRRQAARVFAIRGESEAFQRQISAALRLAPEDPLTWHLLTELQGAGQGEAQVAAQAP